MSSVVNLILQSSCWIGDSNSMARNHRLALKPKMSEPGCHGNLTETFAGVPHYTATFILFGQLCSRLNFDYAFKFTVDVGCESLVELNVQINW